MGQEETKKLHVVALNWSAHHINWMSYYLLIHIYPSKLIQDLVYNLLIHSIWVYIKLEEMVCIKRYKFSSHYSTAAIVHKAFWIYNWWGIQKKRMHILGFVLCLYLSKVLWQVSVLHMNLGSLSTMNLSSHNLSKKQCSRVEDVKPII